MREFIEIIDRVEDDINLTIFFLSFFHSFYDEITNGNSSAW